MVRLLLSRNFAKNDEALLLSIPQWCDCCDLFVLLECSISVAFNPTMVRLLPKMDIADLQNAFETFNPTMVRLLRLKFTIPPPRQFAFNPTMVRLLLRRAQKRGTLNYLSIPQWCDCCPTKAAEEEVSEETFNPTMVRLLQNPTSLIPFCCNSFNPTMVRLLLAELAPIIAQYPAFQSHNGAIAASEKFNLPLLLPNFQSHNGAIAALRAKINNETQQAFNPTMVRLLLSASKV